MRLLPSRFFVPAALLGAALGLAFCPSAPAAEPGPHGALKVAVPRDVAAYVIPGQHEARRPIVYLPGRCGDAFAAIKSWPDASRKHGTLVVVQGDEACPGSKRRRWGPSAVRSQARIDAALAAASAEIPGGLDVGGLTVVGYSEGALKAELLARRFPERYPRVVVIGDPRAPSPTNLGKARAIVTMVGERDDQKTMRDGTAALVRAGLPVRLFLLPKAGHGQYGPEGSRVMDEALSWAFATSP
jgi:hypothetical protein